ncbi:MAG: dTMP kinase [Pseudomonadota bacterium]
MSERSGMFVSFEGLEGVGKSTSIQMAADWLQARGIGFISTREPGGTPVAERIRDIALGHHDEQLTDASELLLMFAARSQNVENVIRPALARGDWVLCDRFTDTTLAYQGYARGFALDAIYRLADLVHGDMWPARTLLLQAEPAIIRERLADRGSPLDRIEQQGDAFFARAGAGYAALAEAHADRYRVIDTGGTLNDMVMQIDQVMAEAFAAHHQHS